MYALGEDIIRQCNEQNCRICDIVLVNEARLQECTVNEIRQKLWESFEVMDRSCRRTLTREIPSLSGLTSGSAMRLNAYQKHDDPLCGEWLIKGVAYALSCFEVNTSMGCICAAPTAGSCGILPGALIAAAEKQGAGKEKIIDALATASGIGQIIYKNATISGAEGGCQAECGSASAMAAAAIVEMRGGSVQQSFDAAATTLKNVMGLVCDPIAGLVEVPCAKRNAIGVANAMLSADLALAGIGSIVPFDEVVTAMYKVGKSLPHELRETALGGIAATKTGLRIKEELLGSSM